MTSPSESPEQAQARARVGSSLRRKYHLDALLGVGGMGAVYAATHRNQSRVAIKILDPALARLADVRARFLREGYAANRVTHPGAVRVLDDDDDDAALTVFLVLELLDGTTVGASAAGSAGRLPVGVVLDLAARLLDVLAAAHASGVVHRDIKPDNLFLTRTGELKVLDFGIARILDGARATQTGQIMGTPAFMAPEQAAGRIRDIDGRTDLWSVGATMFSLLSGRDVHEGPTAIQQIVFAATQPAPKLLTVAPGVDARVAAVVDRALAFAPGERWPTAAEMGGAVRELLRR